MTRSRRVARAPASRPKRPATGARASSRATRATAARATAGAVIPDTGADSTGSPSSTARPTARSMGRTRLTPMPRRAAPPLARARLLRYQRQPHLPRAPRRAIRLGLLPVTGRAAARLVTPPCPRARRVTQYCCPQAPCPVGPVLPPPCPPSPPSLPQRPQRSLPGARRRPAPAIDAIALRLSARAVARRSYARHPRAPG